MFNVVNLQIRVLIFHSQGIGYQQTVVHILFVLRMSVFSFFPMRAGGFSEKSFFDTHIGHNVRGVVHISNCAGNVFQTHEKARVFNGAVPSSSGKEGHTRMEYRLQICRDNDAVYRA